MEAPLLTSIVSTLLQQFTTGHFDSSYYPTSKRETHNLSVILNDKTYQLREEIQRYSDFWKFVKHTAELLWKLFKRLKFEKKKVTFF